MVLTIVSVSSGMTRASRRRIPASFSPLARKARFASWVRPDRISLPMIRTQAVTVCGGVVGRRLPSSGARAVGNPPPFIRRGGGGGRGGISVGGGFFKKKKKKLLGIKLFLILNIATRVHRMTVAILGC